ncbi:APC family permease [Cryobacterium tepidiphilum]|uniref:APC family permease n=1 Tax=Cryobacterium tepidiphilum TaxID=2486026 RepID=A0A3M8LRD4_9MICO|nr:APC family permease [Cryobacterium tepidiphilum]RNE67439.1 APC family permease [Cryobacterium tepidiphilum]
MALTKTPTPIASQPGTLKRSLKLRHIVFIGLAYMAPLAVFDTFGIVADTTGGHVPLAYLLILVAVLFTAFSYAKMVRVYPQAGSAYTYTRKTISSHLGFLVGWAATLDYLFLPMINALLSSIYMGAAFPSVPAWVWIVSTIVICTVLNLVGIRLAVKVNYALVIIQVIVAVAFVAFTIKNIVDGARGAEFSVTPFVSPGLDVPAVAAGASILALSFLGFDAVTTLSEEAINPKRDVPRAIFIIVAAAGVFFVGITYFMQVLFPDVSEIADIAGASPEMAKYIGGAFFQAVFLAGYLIAVLGCGLTQQMSAARLLFAMGRDGVLPRKVFGYVHPKSGIPVINILLIAVLASSAVFLDLYQAASLINFGAFVAFAFVNLSVIAHYLRFLKGKSGASVIGHVVVPAIGVVINVALWFSLEPSAMIVGFIWVAIGLAYVLCVTRMFRKQAPQFVELRD